jgi:hypothetical protein
MDFSYLTETKNEFNSFLANILIPNIYNDLQLMLDKSKEMFERLEKEKKNYNKYTVIDIFIMILNSKSELNNYEIEREYVRIKTLSGCSDWFDNLIKASFKSYVLFLTWNSETKTSKYSDNTFYNDISIKDFIHRTFVESCNYFKNNPEILLKKTLKKEIYGIINVCIENAMRNTLPYNEILQEYLLIDFNQVGVKADKEIQKIKSLVNDIITNKKYGSYPKYNNEEETNNNVSNFIYKHNSNLINKKTIDDNFNSDSNYNNDEINDDEEKHNEQINDEEKRQNEQININNNNIINGIIGDDKTSDMPNNKTSDIPSNKISDMQNNSNQDSKQDRKQDSNMNTSMLTRSEKNERDINNLLGKQNNSLNNNGMVGGTEIIDEPAKVKIRPTDRINELIGNPIKEVIKPVVKSKIKVIKTKNSNSNVEMDNFFNGIIR